MLAVTLMVAAQVRLDNHGDYARICVDGEPMLVIGGELGNSSASTVADLRRIFPHLHDLGLNTVLVPVSWCMIEPVEGEFDMTIVQDILDEARKADLKVALLWFGIWKNSMSCYAPDWVKTDTRRFQRAVTAEGKPVEEVSSLSANALESDSRALCKVMEYLRDNDREHTVIMVQVENEMGMIESPRDHSAAADKAYAGKVPDKLRKYIAANRERLHPHLREQLAKGDGGDTWAGMFGGDMYGEEVFQAWTYADYAQQMASRARAVYDLPMFVNVALDSRGRTPGQYPSAGPLEKLIDIWHCGAPDIDVLGLDLYDKGFADWCERYHRSDNPLFIPEIRLEDRDAMFALYAFGHHDAMGFCPFSIEDYPLMSGRTSNDWRGIDLSSDDQLNTFGGVSSSFSPLASAYRLLRQAEPLIIKTQGTDSLDAVLLDNDSREAEIFTPDGVRVTVRHSLSLGWEPASRDSVWPEAACMLIRLASDDYLVLGSDVVLTFTPADSGSEWMPGDERIGILSCDEVEIDGGRPSLVRRLSGDQTHQGRHVRIPHGQWGMQRVRLYRYK